MRQGWIICFFLLIVLSACEKEILPVEDMPEKQTSLSVKETEPITKVIQDIIESEKKNYLLEIKGNSNRLSNSAWNRMQDWREQIVNFSKEYEHVYINGPDQKMVALTFDDGPDQMNTEAIVDVLAERNVIGNFFFVGSNVRKYPEVVKKAYKHGNLVLSHSHQHLDLSEVTAKELNAEIKNAEEAIEEVIGLRPAILRPPYGETDEQVVKVAVENGYAVVLWSIDTLDWSQKEADNIVRNVMDNVRNGDIILMHTTTDNGETLKAVPVIIEELQKRDFNIVGLDQLLNIKAYQ